MSHCCPQLWPGPEDDGLWPLGSPARGKKGLRSRPALLKCPAIWYFDSSKLQSEPPGSPGGSAAEESS